MSKSGGCLCGGVTYIIEGEPVSSFLCHCKNCQKQSGSAFSINLIYPTHQLDLRGDVTTFTDKGESGGTVLRKFCGKCGSPILSAISDHPEIIVLKVGTLDDNSDYDPGAEVWCDSRQDWVNFDKIYPAFPKNPPA